MIAMQLLNTTILQLILLILSRTSASFSMKSPSSTSSYLADVPLGAPDPILSIIDRFKACPSPDKVNISIGAYRDENGKPWILPCVRAAERLMLDSPTETKEYINIAGDPSYVNLALKFAYGEKEMDVLGAKLAAVQTLSGTGSLRIGGEFLARFSKAGQKSIYIPNPTWGNHMAVFAEAGMDVKRYRYYNPKTNRLDMDGMVEDLRNAPEGSVVLFHACAHNPTGCDPTHDEWKILSDLCKEKGLRVFFDNAYQGFASGDSEADAYALRFFVEEGHGGLMLAQSFAKNFGLYGERVGTLSVLTGGDEERERVLSQLKLIVRPMYSSPPIHGSSIVRTVLSSEELRKQYYGECKQMSMRINSMRTILVEKLKEAGSTHDWSHITSQIGMFAYTGLSGDMCDELTSEHFIFLTRNGRVSLAGLTEANIEYVAKAIHAVTDGKSITAE